MVVFGKLVIRMVRLKRIDDDSLMHYGTEGMHWGVRLYQNKDGSLTPLGRIRYYGTPLSREESIKIKRQRQEAKKMQLMAKGNKRDIYKNRDLFTDDEYDEALARAAKFDKTREELRKEKKDHMSSVSETLNKDVFATPKQALKERILQSDNPLAIVKNSSLFTDEELSQAYMRLQRINNIKSLSPSQKMKATDAARVVDKGKPFVENIANSLDKADRLVNTTGKTIIDTYQTTNKINSIINTINGNDDLPTFALQPWTKLEPKNKKISKDDFKETLKTYGLDGSLSSQQIDEMYKAVTGS